MKQRQIHENPSQQFEKIYRKYYQGLFTLATAITGSESNGKDVVADVFYHLWTKAKPDFNTIQNVKAYLYTSVRNQALKSLSADPSRFNEKDHDLRMYAIEHLDPEELLIGRELEAFLNAVIDELPPHCCVVFKLFHEKDYTQEQIANELGISAETVRYHLKTALKKIRMKLETEFDNTRVVNWYQSLALLFLLDPQSLEQLI